MISAALDTSHFPSLAIRRGEEILYDGSCETMGRHSDRDLVPWLSAGFDSAAVDVADVRHWTVGTGPGSFSGIRVGIALIKGIRAATGARLRGIPSSVAVALDRCFGKAAEIDVGVLHDARRGQLILTRFHWSGSTADLRQVGEAALVEPTALATAPLANLLLVSPHTVVANCVDAPVRERLTLVPGIEARHLLDPPGCAWPATAAATAKSLEPVYVRPPVFVEPRPPRRSGHGRA